MINLKKVVSKLQQTIEMLIKWGYELRLRLVNKTIIFSMLALL